MEQQQLQALTEELSFIYFHKPFLHQAYFNPRLRTTGGRYLLSSHDIEINKKYYEEQGLEELAGIIKHELCHYHLHLEGKGYQHRDADFRELLQKVGAPRFCRPLASRPQAKPVKRLEYRCKTCGTRYMRRRRINTERYVCGKCKGKLIFIGELGKI
ncbi:SprT family protein [Bacillus massiliglaciei]|uniref:SprT family protein n=1 Tax=Bacillus massiliglaciei TaxID=1816693 RepID=UPI000ADFB09D|nr:SprT family protein [Bacillus massiliglaciei]